MARIPETLLRGDPTPSFLNTFSRVASGNAVVLDVGPGTGHSSLAMARRLSAREVICLEVSEEMLEKLRRRAAREWLEHRIHILHSPASATGRGSETGQSALGGPDEQPSNPLLDPPFLEWRPPEEALKFSRGVARQERTQGFICNPQGPGHNNSLRKSQEPREDSPGIPSEVEKEKPPSGAEHPVDFPKSSRGI